MAIRDALQVIDQSWTEIEPRLTVRELAALAAIQPEHPGWAAEWSESVFVLLSPALPPQHPAWRALRSSGTRFTPGQQDTPVDEIIGRFIDRARTAMADPSFDYDIAADSLTDSVIQEIISSGIPAERQVDETVPLAVEYLGQRFYPRFQFTQSEPSVAEGIVSQVNDLLGGHEDPIGAISWWLTPNTWLGQAPAELLGKGRNAEIEYAANQLSNDNW
jgi:hypothetical protein